MKGSLFAQYEDSEVFSTKKQSTMLTQQRSLEISLDDCRNERAKIHTIHTGGLSGLIKNF